MTATLLPFSQQESQENAIRFDGVRWSTFQALVAELEADRHLQLTYNTEMLVAIDLRGRREKPRFPLSLRGISWPTYKALMADVGDNRLWRITYDRGVLEIRMPRAEHEEPKELLGDLITVMVDELGMEMRKLGALTLEREDLARAAEPDACFYLQNEAIVRGRNIDLRQDPPPDLVIESDYTHSSIYKHSLYAALGVPEIWRYRQNTLEIYHLSGAEYIESRESLAFPFLPVREIPRFVRQSQEIGQRAIARQFRDRIREILARDTP
ncbi:MAG: Uma2 family endonuclease [Spirulina sp.]